MFTLLKHSFYFFEEHLLQVFERGQPMHFDPLFFSLYMYMLDKDTQDNTTAPAMISIMFKPQPLKERIPNPYFYYSHESNKR